MEIKRDAVDPIADLATISSAKRNVAVDDFLNFGPWWYAPALATLMGGLSLFGQDFTDRWSVVYGAIGVLAGAIMAVHDYRRRRIRPKGSPVAFLLLIAMLVITWIAIGSWGTAISTIGYEDFVPTYAIISWMLTFAFFLVIRSCLHLIRQRRGRAK